MTDLNKSIKRQQTVTTDGTEDNSFIGIDSNIICEINSELDDKDLIGCQIGCNCLNRSEQNSWPQNLDQFEDNYCECSYNRCNIGHNYDKSGLLINWCKPVYECGDNCFCNSSSDLKNLCRNRWTQRQTECLIHIFHHPFKGYSVRTLNDLKFGQFVAEYCGEVIDKVEAKQRFQLYSDSEEKHNYILIFREHFGSESTSEIIIDAKEFANESRFINHSCSPNLIPIPVRSDSLRPRICLFAAEDIAAGSELSYNYGSDNSPLSSKTCFCGSDKCRGFMPLDTTL